jgi:hypothetical protein
VETVCSTCGEQNAAGTQFCWSCHAYLGWQDQPRSAPLDSRGSTASHDPPRSAPAPDPALRAPAPPRPFEAELLDPDAEVPVDGTPAVLRVNIANTSAVVESYVVEPVDVPSWLTVRAAAVELLPGNQGILQAELRVEPPALVPAQQLAVHLRVRATTGAGAHRDLSVPVTVPVVDAPVDVRAEPRLLRTHDLAPAYCTVVVDNTRSNRWAQVQLSGTDPEHAVRVTFQVPQLQVPPGGTAHSQVRFEAPPPDPGGETSRTVTVTAGDGRRDAVTTVTLVQTASRAALELLALQLDPSVVRLGGGRRGHTTALVDNRRGAGPVSVSLHGDDPENSLRFAFSPARVHAQPGTVARVRVTVTAPRIPPGQEVTRSMVVVASDGRSETRAEGSVIQLAASRRGIARLLLTVLGGLAMLLAAWLPFSSVGEDRAVDATAARIADDVNGGNIPAGGLENMVSVGLVLMVLGGLVIFGLTGRSGLLTRLSALLAAALVVAAFVGLALLGNAPGPAAGSVLALAGCVAAYVGGLLARR